MKYNRKEKIIQEIINKKIVLGILRDEQYQIVKEVIKLVALRVSVLESVNLTLKVR